ncbi:hypothetical protein HPP92_011222 [Vanilla planifolia]|uniref:SHSP domain-containing protein n=1 Tax=Vanilla planifolia TaxID=51239 RepID=A0A835QX69_VANPL|nr:hypothetical protein HPP92_011222 [Vanilla planifolia]
MGPRSRKLAPAGCRQRRGERLHSPGAHVDWRETPDAHLFLAELPGVREGGGEGEVEDGGVLRISGRGTRRRSRGGYGATLSAEGELRRLRLPENAKPEEIRASMENGLLTVTVPKRERFAEEARTVRSIDVA